MIATGARYRSLPLQGWDEFVARGDLLRRDRARGYAAARANP